LVYEWDKRLALRKPPGTKIFQNQALNYLYSNLGYQDYRGRERGTGERAERREGRKKERERKERKRIFQAQSISCSRSKSETCLGDTTTPCQRREKHPCLSLVALSLINQS
jgi:hypothetical protein